MGIDLVTPVGVNTSFPQWSDEVRQAWKWRVLFCTGCGHCGDPKSRPPSEPGPDTFPGLTVFSENGHGRRVHVLLTSGPWMAARHCWGPVKVTVAFLKIRVGDVRSHEGRVEKTGAGAPSFAQNKQTNQQTK